MPSLSVLIVLYFTSWYAWLPFHFYFHFTSYSIMLNLMHFFANGGSFGIALLGKSQKWSLLAYIFGGTSFLSNLNYTGHKQEALDTKLRGHFILKAANDYSWEQIFNGSAWLPGRVKGAFFFFFLFFCSLGPLFLVGPCKIISMNWNRASR